MVIKIGNVVKYRSSFGHGEVKQAKVLTIEHCKDGGKYGEAVDCANSRMLGNCVIDLDDNHWCYGRQIISVIT